MRTSGPRQEGVAAPATGFVPLGGDGGQGLRKRVSGRRACGVEADYEVILRSISDAVFVSDDAGTLTFACPNVAGIFGRSSEEVLEMGSVSALLGDGLYDPDELQRVGELANIEVDVRDKAGEVHNLLVNVKHVALGCGTRLYSCRDVTAHRRAERALQRERQRLVCVLETIPAFVYLQAPDHTIRYANSHFVKRFGDPAGRHCYDIIAGRQGPCTRCPTFKVFETGAPERWEWTSNDGRSYMIYNAPIVDIDGSPLVLEMGIDITERRQAEEQLRERESELARATRLSTMGVMATSLAHELNQPLGAVCAHADACQARLRRGNVENLAESVEQIAVQAQQAAQIVRRVREFCRTRAPVCQFVEINTVIRDAMALTETALRKDGIAVTLALSDGLPGVWGDAIQLQQVILNLVRNAVDAIRQAGRDEQPVTITSAADEAGVAVHVRDAGIGLDEDTLARVFEPFYTTKAKGMGMGLAICRTIIEAHGGKLWATRNPDRGVTFHLRLPATTKERNKERVKERNDAH